MRLEHWTNAAEQGAAAARNLLATAAGGDGTPYQAVPFFWSDQYDARIQFLGRPEPSDEVAIVHGSLAERRFVALYGRARAPPGRARRQPAEAGDALPSPAGTVGELGRCPRSRPRWRKVECHTLKVGCNLQVQPYPAVMADTDTTSLALPVVPLPDGVVFPGTVVTLALESDEARAAVAAATRRRPTAGCSSCPRSRDAWPTWVSSRRSRTPASSPVGARPPSSAGCSEPAWVRAWSRSGRASGSRPSRCPTPGPACASRPSAVSCGSCWRRSPRCAGRGACPRSCAPSATPAPWPTPPRRGPRPPPTTS